MATMHTEPAWMRRPGYREVVPTGAFGRHGGTWKLYRDYRKMGYSDRLARRLVMSVVFTLEHSLKS